MAQIVETNRSEAENLGRRLQVVLVQGGCAHRLGPIEHIAIAPTGKQWRMRDALLAGPELMSRRQPARTGLPRVQLTRWV
ncbi:hypothetical protein MMIN_26460 [Mycolicibacter minnesotensis]|nr:hypothetical protein MMIN_26460 [Mycolicibacter minnesotensis]